MEVTKGKNDKQAAEYIRRLANGEIPEMKVEVNYSESKDLETLDENSNVLARTYMTALSDRQKIEKAKLKRLAVAAV